MDYWTAVFGENVRISCRGVFLNLISVAPGREKQHFPEHEISVTYKQSGRNAPSSALFNFSLLTHSSTYY